MKVAGFFSDPHFGHKNIIKYCQRPFKSTHDMHTLMVKYYNTKVGSKDLLYWVGDNFFNMGILEAAELLGCLNGYKVLIMGNHDVHNGKNFMARCGFDAVIEKEAFLCIGGKICRVCHYPYWKIKHSNEKVDDRYKDRRPPKVKGEVLIHGHTHSTKRRDGNMIHVGVDAWNYGPAMIEDVANLVAEV